MKPKITFNTSGNSYAIKYPSPHLSTPASNTYVSQAPAPVTYTTSSTLANNTGATLVQTALPQTTANYTTSYNTATAYRPATSVSAESAGVRFGTTGAAYNTTYETKTYPQKPGYPTGSFQHQI